MRDRMDRNLVVRLPSAIADALIEEARRQFLTPSALIRQIAARELNVPPPVLRRDRGRDEEARA